MIEFVDGLVLRSKGEDGVWRFLFLVVLWIIGLVFDIGIIGRERFVGSRI